MSTSAVSTNAAAAGRRVDLRLEAVTLPVSDVNRAREF